MGTRRGELEARDQALLFVGALVIRMLGLVIGSWMSPYRLAADASLYDGIAQSLLRGEGIAYGGRSTAFVGPGYPVFLAGVYALLGRDLGAVGVVHAVLGAGSSVLAANLGGRLGGNGAAWAAGVLVAAYPHFLHWSGLALTENLFLPLVVLSLWLLIGAEAEGRTWRYALAGMTFAIATLVRGNLIVFLPVAALHIWLYGGARTRRRGTSVFVLAAVLSIMPWIVRNSIVVGTPTLATESGYVLWSAHNPNAGRRHTGGYITAEPLAEPASDSTEGAASAHYARAALTYLASDPLSPLRHAPAKLWNMWRPTFDGSKVRTWVVFGGSYFLLAGLSGWGWVLTRGQATARLLAWFVVTLTVSHALMLAEIRYRMPIELALAVFAGAGGADIAARCVARLRTSTPWQRALPRDADGAIV